MLFVALALSGNEVAAVLRADDLDPQIARYTFDEGQAAFANARVAPWQLRRVLRLGHRVDPILPRWVGWLTIAKSSIRQS